MEINVIVNDFNGNKVIVKTNIYTAVIYSSILYIYNHFKHNSKTVRFFHL